MSDGERAGEWRRAELCAVCGSLEPWAYGTVALAEQYPTYYEYNHLRVEREPELSLEELIAVADTALAGRTHRRIDFADAEHARRFRDGFAACGWKVAERVRMRHSGTPPAAPDVAVQAVAYDAAADLRLAWDEEDWPGVDTAEHRLDARAVELARGAQVLAAPGPDGGSPIAFAQVETLGNGAEVTSVYVATAHRGRGLGTAVTVAAIRHALPVRDLWITADAEGRPQRLYERLGFRPVARDTQFLRLPA